MAELLCEVTLDKTDSVCDRTTTSDPPFYGKKAIKLRK